MSRKPRPGPAPAQWPGVEQAATPLTVESGSVESGSVESGSVTAIRAMLPAGVTALLDAFTAATQGGRAITDGVLKNAVERMWVAYRAFENALKTGEDGYQADLTGSAPFIVDVATSEGRKSLAAAFAREIADALDDQGALLDQRERTVLEDSLMPALAQQIHDSGCWRRRTWSRRWTPTPDPNRCPPAWRSAVEPGPFAEGPSSRPRSPACSSSRPTALGPAGLAEFGGADPGDDP